MAGKSSEICAIVLESRGILIDTVAEMVGLTDRQMDALVGKLCGEGTLKRENDRLNIANVGRARLLAESAPTLGPGVVKAKIEWEPSSISRAPITPPQDGRKMERVPIPVPAKLEVRKGIPIPPKRKGGPKESPWHKHFVLLKEVGDSIEIDVPDGFTAKETAEQLRKYADSYKRLDPSFRAAVRMAEGNKKVGVWRADLGAAVKRVYKKRRSLNPDV